MKLDKRKQELKSYIEAREKATQAVWSNKNGTRYNDDCDEEPINGEFVSIGPIEYAGCGSHRLTCLQENAEFIVLAANESSKIAEQLLLAIEALEKVQAGLGGMFGNLNISFEDDAKTNGYEMIENALDKIAGGVS